MSSGLSLLSQVDDESLRKQKDLPSWCPDYSVSEFHPPLGDMLVDWYDALPSRRKFCSADVDTQTLILEGLYVENITRLGPSVHKISVQELLEFCLTLHITYHNGQDRTEAVWRTSIADHFSNACPAPTEMTATCFTDWLLYSVANCIHGNNDGQDLPPYEEWSEWSCFDELHESSPTAAKNVPSTAVLAAYTERMRTMLVTSKGSAPEARQLQGGHDFYGSAVLWAGNRTLFVTASGSIGLAPPSSKDGDQVWFVSGAKVPFILRPVEDGRHYRLIGEAYVHGYMHGEVLEEMQDRGFQEIMLR
ncbi:hypothetical protein B0A55_10109 [Friedmanniomyces simplex]|uniref:Heterokaryon incompatibility domain-containing protein n=1 Tax=Friedmanniomyces simplex TaxID=329884 RepID=A0A4U0WNE5_9PEZI|nr:hypothetical protein B0A55_10109 [Friedmanniomyces simplex]